MRELTEQMRHTHSKREQRNRAAGGRQVGRAVGWELLEHVGVLQGMILQKPCK